MRLSTIVFLAILMALFSSCAISSSNSGSEDKNAWLPLNREQIVATALRIMESDFPNGLTFSEYKELEKVGDEVWLYGTQKLPYIMALVGSGERVHSLKISILISNLDRVEADKAFGSVSEIFGALFPDWKDAKNWPTQGLRGRLRSPEDILKENRHGIAISMAADVDIVFYVITVRDRCIPSRDDLYRFSRVRPCRSELR